MGAYGAFALPTGRDLVPVVALSTPLERSLGSVAANVRGECPP